MKSCLGWFALIVGWFLLWTWCMDFGDKNNVSPFGVLGCVILCVVGLCIIGLLIVGYSSRQFDKKVERCMSIQKQYPNAYEDFCKLNNISVSENYNKESVRKILEVPVEEWTAQEKKYDRCKTVKKNYPKAYNDYCKNNHIISYRRLTPENAKNISKVSDKEWHLQEKKLLEEERRIHIAEINDKYDTAILSNNLRERYVGRYLGVNVLPQKFNLQQRESVLNTLGDLDNYISEYLENEYNRIKTLYPDGVENFCVQNNDVDFGDHLEGNAFYEACLESEDDIKKYQKVCNEYAELIDKYPNGIKGYEDSHIKFDDNLCRSWKPGKEEIIQLGEEKLSALEQRSKSVELGKEWIAKQKSLADTLRGNCKKYIPNWGCYFYDLSVETPSFYEHPQINNFRIWQFFYISYCDDTTLDYTLTPSQKNESLKNSKFISRKLSYKDVVYDAIMPFIRFIKEQSKNVCVVFGNSGLDSYEQLNMQFAYLSTLLTIGEDISCYDSIRDIVITDDTCVIVFELITSNDFLRKQCYEIIKSKRDRYPTICYISMRKGYDTDEMIELIEKAKEKAQKEREERERQEREEREAKQRRLEVTSSLRHCASSWKKILGLPCCSLLPYYPTTCDFEADEEEWADRWTVWNFKNTPGKTSEQSHRKTLSEVVPRIKCVLVETFGNSNLRQLTLVCIPASTAIKTEARYSEFSNWLCQETGMTNAYSHISVIRNSEEKKFGGSGITTNNVQFDEDFFKDKNVILFDDVITKGESMSRFRRKLESLGANVICGFSIGRTTHER